MWKPVCKYEGKYEVSDDGFVKRLKGFWCKKDRLLALHESNTGYLRAYLSIKEHRNPKKYSVHRLVYEAFIGPIPKGMTVHHLNGDKHDNRTNNLALASMPEQMIHAYKSGLQPHAKGEARKNVARLTENQVLEIRAAYIPRKVTYKVLAERFSVSPACILTVVRRLRWTHI